MNPPRVRLLYSFSLKSQGFSVERDFPGPCANTAPGGRCIALRARYYPTRSLWGSRKLATGQTWVKPPKAAYNSELIKETVMDSRPDRVPDGYTVVYVTRFSLLRASLAHKLFPSTQRILLQPSGDLRQRAA